MMIRGLLGAAALVALCEAFGSHPEGGSCPLSRTEPHQMFTCNNLGYHVSFPEGHSCLQTESCGLIFDIHGATMTMDLLAAINQMAAKAGPRGYIVVTPQAPVRNLPAMEEMGLFDRPVWSKDEDWGALKAFIRQAVGELPIDRSRVHITGFSQGGYASWSLQCELSDIICSAAPLGASGRDAWTQMDPMLNSMGTGHCFEEGGPAAGPRSVLYGTGVTDPFSGIDAANALLQTISADAPVMLRGGDTYRRMRVKEDQGTVIEAVQFDGGAPPYEGHCIPVAQDQCEAVRAATGGGMSTACCQSFSWSDLALDFFEQHPCSQ